MATRSLMTRVYDARPSPPTACTVPRRRRRRGSHAFRGAGITPRISQERAQLARAPRGPLRKSREEAVPQGKVKWFSSEKAYGFIAQDDDDDIFVHVTGLAEGVTTLEPEQLVEFEVVQGRKGQQAANVKPVSRSAA